MLSKILMKLTAGVNFINFLSARFSYETLFSSYVLAKKAVSYEKRTRKPLTKLTPEQYYKYIRNLRFQSIL